jgi:hypothetical protein
MVHACDDCASKNGFTMRCSEPDGFRNCFVCGRRTHCDLWSMSKTSPLCSVLLVVAIVAFSFFAVMGYRLF